MVDLALIAMNHPQAVGRDDGQFVIGQIDDLVGVAGQGRGVAGHEMLAGADADDQRASQPGGDQHLGPLAEENRQAVGPLELRQGRLDRGDQRLVARRPPCRPPAAGASGNCRSDGRSPRNRWPIERRIPRSGGVA